MNGAPVLPRFRDVPIRECSLLTTLSKGASWIRTGSKARPRKSKARSRTTRAARPRASAQGAWGEAKDKADNAWDEAKDKADDAWEGVKDKVGDVLDGDDDKPRGRPRVEEHEFDRIGASRGALRRFSAAADARQSLSRERAMAAIDSGRVRSQAALPAGSSVARA